MSKPCVIWDGRLSVGGYGILCVGRQRYVHRLVCTFFHGDPPFPRAEVLHSCDTPSCYEPSHLRWGTHADNMREAAARGRIRHGEGHYQAKLSAAEVVEIRRRVATGEQQAVMAREYGICRQQISRICRGERWKPKEESACQIL